MTEVLSVPSLRREAFRHCLQYAPKDVLKSLYQLFFDETLQRNLLLRSKGDPDEVVMPLAFISFAAEVMKSAVKDDPYSKDHNVTFKMPEFRRQLRYFVSVSYKHVVGCEGHSLIMSFFSRTDVATARRAKERVARTSLGSPAPRPRCRRTNRRPSTGTLRCGTTSDGADREDGTWASMDSEKSGIGVT